MKREILCSECEPKLRALFPSYSPHPGEYVEFVNGKAKSWLMCDHCGQLIKIGDNCTAMSLWADYGGIPYYEWEPEYLQIDGTET